MTALLVDGDLQLGATGTVTRVDGKGRFLAFGHPFLGAGAVELPVAPAEVVAVFPSAMLSFKMAYALAPAYRLTRDRDSGVAGRTDRAATLLPVRFRLESEGAPARTLSWGVAKETALLPVLVAISMDAAFTTLDSTAVDRTLRLRVSVSTTAGPFVYADQMTGPRAKELALMTVNVLTGLVAQNEFEDPGLSGVDISIASTSGEKRLRVVGAALSARKVAPGQTLRATVRLVDRRGREETRVLSLAVPKETPEGRAMVIVGDGNAASSARLAAQPRRSGRGGPGMVGVSSRRDHMCTVPYRFKVAVNSEFRRKISLLGHILGQEREAYRLPKAIRSGGKKRVRVRNWSKPDWQV